MSTSVPPPGFVPPPSYAPAPVGEPAPREQKRSRRGISASPKLVVGTLAVAAVAGIAFVLFGSGGNQFGDAIARAATISASSPGYRENMTIEMTAPMLRAPITISAGGLVDLRDHAASMSMAMDFSQLSQASQVLGSSSLRMDMILEGHVIYMKLPSALAGRVPALAGKPWFKMDLAKLTGLPGISSLTNDPTMTDPTQVLRYLRAKSDSVSDEGQQVVNGVSTTHYRAQLNLSRALPAAAPGALKQALSKLEQAAGTQSLPVDVWIDRNHLVRRIQMALSLHIPSGPALRETVTANLSDYGPQPRPTPPPADQVKDLSSLGGLG